MGKLPLEKNYGGRMDELPHEELSLANEKKPFYKRIAKYVAPPLIGITMLTGCATTRLYERIEPLPDEIDVLEIDSRPQGAEVIYQGKAIGKTPMQATVTFKWQKRMDIKGTEKGGRITEEKIRDTFAWATPATHSFRLYTPGYFIENIEHGSDEKNNRWNYFGVLRENGNKPLIHQEQKVIIKQEGKLDKIEIK